MNIAFFLNTSTILCFSFCQRLENRKEMTKQGVEKEEEGTCIQGVLASQAMQRCGSKLAEKESDREREREAKLKEVGDAETEKKMHKRVRRNVISLFNINIYIYIFLLLPFFILTP